MDGTICPVPEGAPLRTPHKLVLDTGEELECWINTSEGAVKCQPIPGQTRYLSA
jgi:hypothetical protein